MTHEIDTIVLLAIMIAFCAIILLVALAGKINSFSHELNYINTEINRTEGDERQYWKCKKRRLWLSLLPFFSK